MKLIVIVSILLHTMVTMTLPIEIEKILKSGDGKSIETAYKVNSVEEEYGLLRHLKLTPNMQKLHIKNGYFYDEIKTNAKTIYFKLITKKLTTIPASSKI